MSQDTARAGYELTCADCGADHEVTRSDALYCPSCRLRRDIAFSRKRVTKARTCKGCGKKYRMRNARDWSICGHCEAAEQKHEGTCSLCQGPRTTGSPLPNVCLPCIKDPKIQNDIQIRLVAGKAQRATANAATLKMLEDGSLPHLRKIT